LILKAGYDEAVNLLIEWRCLSSSRRSGDVMWWRAADPKPVAARAASAADAGLQRYLARPGALITIEELREVSGLVGVDPDHDPGLPPWLSG
jgi:hypothetical protein